MVDEYRCQFCLRFFETETGDTVCPECEELNARLGRERWNELWDQEHRA